MTDTAPASFRTGLTAAISAYCLWGVSGLFFKALSALSPGEVISYRILFSLLAMLPFMLRGSRLSMVISILRTPRLIAVFAGSALMITVNWLIFVYAIGINKALYASLGYYVFPLVTLGLAALFLKERFTRQQGVAVALVLAGVVVLIGGLGSLPWITLALALSFGVYGLLRKKTPVDSLTGLFVETVLLTPFALLWLVWTEGSTGGFLTAVVQGREDWHLLLLLAVGCPLWTALPLYLFGVGARHLRLSTLGLMQYLNPTLQFTVAVAIFHEQFTIVHAVTFALIWTGIAVYSLPFRRRPVT